MRSNSIGVNTSNSGVTTTVDCPDDWVATGGGFRVAVADEDYVVRFSGPLGDAVDSPYPTKWQVEVHFNQPTTGTVEVWAVCEGVATN
jgi:hypothetical protein